MASPTSPALVDETSTVDAIGSRVHSPETKATAHARAQEHEPQALSRSAQTRAFNWTIFTFMLVFHVGAIAALFFFSWHVLLLLVVLHVVAINVGIGMGYHRLLTHRGFKTPKLVEYFLAVCGPLALEGGPIFWVGTHRLHHQLSDKTGDPHTPTEGGWWAHVGWILSGESLHAQTVMLGRYAPDLTKDRFHVWLSKYHWVPLTIVGLGLLAIGGWTWVLWGIFFRVTVGLRFDEVDNLRFGQARQARDERTR